LVSLLPAIHATRLLAFTLAGLFPLNAPAFAGRTTGLSFVLGARQPTVAALNPQIVKPIRA
jgi:hypothetical protein